MAGTLFLFLSLAALAVGLWMRKREGADQRLIKAIFGVGIVLMSVSIVLSGLAIARH